MASAGVPRKIDYILSFGAGALTTLSPCVLPLLPIIVGGVMQRNRFAPALMAKGMIGTFVGVGMLLAQAGNVLGIERSTLTHLAAALFVMTGAILVVPKLHSSFNRLRLPLSVFISRLGAKAESLGAFGYILAGALLGLIWAPCSGPTLGVAFTLAAKDDTLLRAAPLMSLFGLGSSIPILGVAYGPKNIFISKRRVLIKRGAGAKTLLGSMMILLGVLALTGIDKTVE